MAKILLVEDDNNLREIYEARLQAEGYEIVSARDGEEALSVAIKERPDLIISDVMMPKISGFDMLDIIRSTEETKNVKVIMMTALSQAEDRDRATKLGANRYLVKSQVTLEDVARVAKEVLNEDETKADNNANNVEVSPVAQSQLVTATPSTNSVATPNSATTGEQNPASVAQAPVVVPPTNVAVATPTPIAPSAPITATNETTTTVVTPAPAPTTTNAPVAVSSPLPATPPTTNPEPTVTKQATTAQNSKISVESPTASSEEMEKEQSAIANQIESSMDSRKQAVNPILQTENKVTSTGTQTPTGINQPASSKRVIQPLNNLSQSSKPDLDELLVKEKQKDQMSEVASQIIANQPAKQVETSQPTEQVSTATPTPTGTNIDGVVKQQPPQPPANDPSSIAL